jgi:hypothetical protein
MEQQAVAVSGSMIMLLIFLFFFTWVVFNLSLWMKSKDTDDWTWGPTFMLWSLVMILLNDGARQYLVMCAIVLGISFVIAVCRIIAAYWEEITGWFRRHKERLQKWCEKKRSIRSVRNICKDKKVPPKTLSRLGSAILEWDESKKKLPLLRTSLKKLENDLLRMVAMLQKMRAEAQSAKLDGDIVESYKVTIADLEKERGNLSSLVEELKQEIFVREERLVMIAGLFKEAPEQARIYESFDKNASEALNIQKSLKTELRKLAQAVKEKE